MFHSVVDLVSDMPAFYDFLAAPAVPVAFDRFARHFPYRCMEVQFQDIRQRAFIECWHRFPSASIRWVCKVSGLPRGSAVRLIRRLGRFGQHIRGRTAFGVSIDALPFTRYLPPAAFF